MNKVNALKGGPRYLWKINYEGTVGLKSRYIATTRNDSVAAVWLLQQQIGANGMCWIRKVKYVGMVDVEDAG